MMMSLSASCLEASAQDAAKDSVALQEVVVKAARIVNRYFEVVLMASRKCSSSKSQSQFLDLVHTVCRRK